MPANPPLRPLLSSPLLSPLRSQQSVADEMNDLARLGYGCGQNPDSTMRLALAA
jgi:hypothetical protein